MSGPGAAGGRVAAAALAASTPAARVRWGALQVLDGARLVARDAALRRAALLPTAVTLAGCAAFAAVVTGRDPEGGATARFHAFFVTFVALASMPPTLLFRQWLRVGREARRALGQPPGDEPFEGETYVRTLAREWGKAVRQLVVVSAGLAPLLLVLRLLPLGRVEASAVAWAWAWYWVVVDAFELPVELVPGPRGGAPAPWFGRMFLALGARGGLLRPARLLGRFLVRLTRPWHDEVAFTERHPWEAAGLGVAVAALLAIPVLGVFFRAVAIVAATALVGGLEPGGPPVPLATTLVRPPPGP